MPSASDQIGLRERLRVLGERLRAINLNHREVQPSNLGESIALLRDTAIFFAVVSYFVGWVYLNEYLRNFGIYLANLNVPLHYVFVFSYEPLLDAIFPPKLGGILKLLGLMIFILICVVAYKSRLVAGYAVALVCSLAILAISFHIARETGRRDASIVLGGGGKPIRFVFDPQVMDNLDHIIASDLELANSEESHPCLRLIWRTDKEVYAVAAGGCDGRKRTFRIPVSTFVFSETYPPLRED